MGVHSKKQKGPNGTALSKLKRSISECTPESERDHMEVHSLKRRGPHGSALVSYLFNRIRVHSHVVPFASRNALRYSPFHYLECSPMWSFLIFRVYPHVSVKIFGVHSDLVLITFENALRSGPPL